MIRQNLQYLLFLLVDGLASLFKELTASERTYTIGIHSGGNKANDNAALLVSDAFCTNLQEALVV